MHTYVWQTGPDPALTHAMRRQNRHTASIWSINVGERGGGRGLWLGMVTTPEGMNKWPKLCEQTASPYRLLRGIPED